MSAVLLASQSDAWYQDQVQTRCCRCARLGSASTTSPTVHTVNAHTHTHTLHNHRSTVKTDSEQIPQNHHKPSPELKSILSNTIHSVNIFMHIELTCYQKVD